VVAPLLRVIPTSWLARGMPERDFPPPDWAREGSQHRLPGPAVGVL